MSALQTVALQTEHVQPVMSGEMGDYVLVLFKQHLTHTIFTSVPPGTDMSTPLFV